MANNAQVLLADFPEDVAPGASFTTHVVMRNSGDTTWAAGGANPYKLSSVNPADNMTFGLKRVDLAADVPPGGSGDFTFTLTAPATPGSYACAWQMVQEFVQRFGEVAQRTVVSGVVTVAPSTRPLPPPSPDPGDVQSALVIWSPVTVIDQGQRHVIRWAAPCDLEVVGCYLWVGVDSGTLADVHAQVNRGSDGSFLALVQWDRYAEPTAPNNHDDRKFDPYLLVARGDTIDLTYRAVQFNGTGKHTEHWVVIFYRQRPAA